MNLKMALAAAVLAGGLLAVAPAQAVPVGASGAGDSVKAAAAETNLVTQVHSRRHWRHHRGYARLYRPYRPYRYAYRPYYYQPYYSSYYRPYYGGYYDYPYYRSYYRPYYYGGYGSYGGWYGRRGGISIGIGF